MKFFESTTQLQDARPPSFSKKEKEKKPKNRKVSVEKSLLGGSELKIVNETFDDNDESPLSVIEVQKVDLNKYNLADIEEENQCDHLLIYILLYASKLHYDVYFLLALNDVICNKSKNSTQKLKTMQDVFLSHRTAKLDDKQTEGSSDKLLINPEFVGKNSPEEAIDDINLLIDLAIQYELPNSRDLIQSLMNFSSMIVCQEKIQFDFFRGNLNTKNIPSKESLLPPIMKKLEQDGFNFSLYKLEDRENSLFKSWF